MGWRRSREARILRVRSNGMSDGNGSLALFLHQELSRPTPVTRLSTRAPKRARYIDICPLSHARACSISA